MTTLTGLCTGFPLRVYENAVGVSSLVGFWDSLGLTASGNVFDYNRRKEVELKHGRVAMFVILGYITLEYYRLF
eukprot:12223428-Heterocapsa_arctica.AAC.1